MHSSLQLAALQPLPVEQKAKENLSHLFVARLWAELCDCQGVRDFSKAAKLVVIGEVDLDSQLVNRHNALGAKSPLPITNHTLVRPLNVVVGRALTESLVGQIGSSLKERICNVFIHGHGVQGCIAFLYSHFSIPFLFVDGAIVSAHQG